RERQDLPEHPVVKGANAWEQGEVIQLQRVQGSGEHGRGDTAHVRCLNATITAG
ncbi:hypothetical protein ONQ97_25635, partial [Salmonella enterica subsp. enterica serovar Virginia]|nr:hypothetical protein [Salmonella enterica subsp. enterica serovar Virginia]